VAAAAQQLMLQSIMNFLKLKSTRLNRENFNVGGKNAG
jgi:hypothetical protein